MSTAFRTPDFRTPDAELAARLEEWREPYEFPGLLPPAFVERHTGSFASSLYHHPERDFAEWQAEGVQTLREALLLPGCLGQPSEPRLLRQWEEADYTVEEVEITLTPPLRVRATVVIPRNGAERHPALLALHSMGGYELFGREKLLAHAGEPASLTAYRQKYYDGRSLQAELARAGFLSIAIDAIGFGLRSQEALEKGADFEAWRHGPDAPGHLPSRIQNDALLSRALLTLGYSTPALVVTDDLRTLDYLATRADVDADRIGCLGLSFGAFRTNYLAALEPRIRAAVSVCWVSTLEGVFPYNLGGALGFFALPPGFYRRFDLADLPALAAPKPYLAISGWADPMLQPAGMAQLHHFLRNVWERAGAEPHLGSLLYETGHCFNAEMQTAALAFLRSALL